VSAGRGKRSNVYIWIILGDFNQPDDRIYVKLEEERFEILGKHGVKMEPTLRKTVYCAAAVSSFTCFVLLADLLAFSRAERCIEQTNLSGMRDPLSLRHWLSAGPREKIQSLQQDGVAE
jgi:hypothetical protein